MLNSLYKIIFHNSKLLNILYWSTSMIGILYLISVYIPYINESIIFYLFVIALSLVIVWKALGKWLQNVDKKNNELLVSAWESISKREFGKAKQKLNSTECLNHYKHRKIFLEAIIDYYQGEYDQSLSKLMSIEQTEYLSDPFLLSLYEYKGYSLTLLRRYSEAIEAYSLSIEGKDEITTDHFVIYQHRGICYHQLKNYEKAISDFDKSINLKPDANSYYNKALSLIAINQLQSALECLNRAIELNNDDIKFYCKRMELHSQMKNWDKIIKDANVLLSLKKYADTAYYHRGLAKCHKGDTEDGLKDLSLVEDEELIIRAHQIIEKLKS